MLGLVETYMPTSGSSQILERHLVLKLRSLLSILEENTIEFASQIAAAILGTCILLHITKYYDLILASLVFLG